MASSAATTWLIRMRPNTRSGFSRSGAKPALLHFFPDADVICDVGGCDVKVMILRQGTVADFRLNSQCSSGNGAFLQGVAERYGVPLESYAERAFSAKAMLTLAMGCGVFLQSDIVNQQRKGWSADEIMASLAAVLPVNVSTSLPRSKSIMVDSLSCPRVMAGPENIKAGFTRDHLAIGLPRRAPPGAEATAPLARPRHSRPDLRRDRQGGNRRIRGAGAVQSDGTQREQRGARAMRQKLAPLHPDPGAALSSGHRHRTRDRNRPAGLRLSDLVGAVSAHRCIASRLALRRRPPLGSNSLSLRHFRRVALLLQRQHQ